MAVEVESSQDKVGAKGDDDNDDEDVELGGESSVPCYCLLDGFFNDPESGEKSRVTIPITKLPATLGRSHDSDDPHFFGLGKKKALSRKQCRIVYRDAQGGKVQWDAVKQHLVYMDPTATTTGDGTDDDGHATLTLSPKNQQLPPNGFFVVENLGKNRILVNQGRVEQGNAAVLQSGSSLRVSSYTLYFLRPLDAKPTQHIIVTQQQPSTNKRKPNPDAPLSSTKRSRVSQQHFDSLPVETLLEQMNEAIDNALWERRHQLIGASIALHAIKEAAKDPGIQTVALNGGVSRSEIMAWVEQSPKYSNWVSQMLLKMEPRSYQAAITKCLLKAGFSRTSSSGRYIKWYLPKDTTIVVPNITKSENITTTTVNKTNSNNNKQNAKQKSHDQQQSKGRVGRQHLHDNENGEEQDDVNEEEEDEEEGSDDEDDEKSGVDDDRDQEGDDQDQDEQDMQDEDDEDDHDQHHDTEEGNEERADHPLRKGDLHEGNDDEDDKSSSSELDRTRPYSSTAHKHANSKDNDDDDEEEEEERREDEQDNYV